MRIICDFDGTISRRDTTDLVLEHLADPTWRNIEEDWLAGRISAAACMRAQVALIGGSSQDLDALLSRAEIDPGFIAFVAWCEARDIPVAVVSDGVDRFIFEILRRHRLDHLPVVANRLVGEAGAWGLEQPWRREGCAAGSGVCKCAAIGVWSGEIAADVTVYVGDGRSDFCVSSRADLLFAKDALADYAAARGRAFIAFETFDDVTRALALRTADMRPAARAGAL
jgi:2,3-diketo-5-methylthio-1-phosphopentane phosphatase